MPFNTHLFTWNAVNCGVTLMYISGIISLQVKKPNNNKHPKPNTKTNFEAILVVLKFCDFGQRTENPSIKDFRPVRSFLQ